MGASSSVTVTRLLRFVAVAAPRAAFLLAIGSCARLGVSYMKVTLVSCDPTYEILVASTL